MASGATRTLSPRQPVVAEAARQRSIRKDLEPLGPVRVPRQVLASACNYASSLVELRRFEEAKSLLHRTLPVARRVLREGDKFTLLMRWAYAKALFYADGSTLDDIREALNSLEDTTRIARRVFGNAHPTTERIEFALRDMRAARRARNTPGSA